MPLRLISRTVSLWLDVSTLIYWVFRQVFFFFFLCERRCTCSLETRFALVISAYLYAVKKGKSKVVDVLKFKLDTFVEYGINSSFLLAFE